MSLLAVQTRGLSMHFESGRAVLEDISFEIESGETIAVAGENGSGKTTLLRILATLLSPTTGDISIFNKSVRDQARELRTWIGWAPAQDQSFFRRLTGLENLIYFGALKNIRADEVKRQIGLWPAIGPLQEALKAPYGVCSTGMRQLLTLGRAFLGEPRLLLLDEPFRGLSPRVTAAVLDILFEKSSTLIVTCHSPAQAPWADRILRLEAKVLEEFQVRPNLYSPELAL